MKSLRNKIIVLVFAATSAFGAACTPPSPDLPKHWYRTSCSDGMSWTFDYRKTPGSNSVWIYNISIDAAKSAWNPTKYAVVLTGADGKPMSYGWGNGEYITQTYNGYVTRLDKFASNGAVCPSVSAANLPA